MNIKFQSQVLLIKVNKKTTCLSVSVSSSYKEPTLKVRTQEKGQMEVLRNRRPLFEDIQ